jgi:regulator of sigma D
MTPKEKAEEIVDGYYQLLLEYISNGHFDIAKQCALIEVEHILIMVFGFESKRKYWQEVKQEIENL